MARDEEKDLQKILVDYSRKYFSDASSSEEEKEEDEGYDGWSHRVILLWKYLKFRQLYID